MMEWLAGGINAQQESKTRDADKLFNRNLEQQRNKEAIDRWLSEQKVGTERFNTEQDFRNRQQGFNENQAKDTQAMAIAPTLQPNTDLTGQLDPKIEEALTRLGQLKRTNTLPSTQSVGTSMGPGPGDGNGPTGVGPMTSTQSPSQPQIMRPSTPMEDMANQGMRLKNQEFDLQKRLTEKSLNEPGIKEMALLNARLALQGGEQLAAFQNGLTRQISPSQALTLMERIMASKDYGENPETYTDFVKTLMGLAKVPVPAGFGGPDPNAKKDCPPDATPDGKGGCANKAPAGPGMMSQIGSFLSGAGSAIKNGVGDLTTINRSVCRQGEKLVTDPGGASHCSPQ